MQIRRLQSTLRNALLALGLVTVILAATELTNRSASYRSLAVYHRESWLKLLICGHEPWRERRLKQMRAGYHFRLTQKYRNAAAYPRLLVEPDPPQPE